MVHKNAQGLYWFGQNIPTSSLGRSCYLRRLYVGIMMAREERPPSLCVASDMYVVPKS